MAKKLIRMLLLSSGHMIKQTCATFNVNWINDLGQQGSDWKATNPWFKIMWDNGERQEPFPNERSIHVSPIKED